jgi:GT2 family glycosyltransferase
MADADDDEFAGEADVAAPNVVAVVVACDPGPWFEECLRALGDQDYPHLSILVIDGGDVDVTPRVATAAPNAYVRRLEENRGFSAAANEVLSVVDGASHYVICHDDVAPDPDAVRLLLEEAFRSNAAVVGPKLVQWDDPTRLLQVGLSADKGGVTTGPVERGELDQEQHDAVRDVFAVPGGLMLVRADLFGTIGGFDTAIAVMGEDLDLCWRAQIAGGRVLVAPAARVRHVEALARDQRPGHEGGRGRLRPLEARHRIRTVLKNYSWFHLLRVLPQLAVLSAGEVVYLFVVGRRRAARSLLQAWWGNVRNFGELRAARRNVAADRVWPDNEVRRLQVHGSARMTRFLRGQLGRSDRARLIEARPWSRAWRPNRLQLGVIGAIAFVLLIGSRALLSGTIPAVGQFQPLPGSTTLLRLFAAGWRTTGLGSPAPSPPAFGLLGVAGTVLLGGVGVLQRLLIVGALPIGLVGVYRLAKPLDSVAGRLITLIVYASIPLPYDAIARGRLSGLMAYAAVPWILVSLARATGTAPFASDEPARRVRVVALGVLLAVVGALAPAILVVTLVAAVGLAVGSVLVGESDRGGPLVVALAAVGVAILLLAPWSIDLLVPGHGAERLTAAALDTMHGPGFGALVRFETGPLGAGPIGWVFLVPAALPLAVGHDWRLRWGARCWSVALVSWLFAWAAGHGWLGLPAPSPELSLAPAAVALALAAGLGLVAFRTDLPAYRFGWRQVASSAAGVAVALGTLPVLGAAVDGRWNLPSKDYRGQLSWMPERRSDGAFRVLWLGEPEQLPLDGWRLGDGVAYGMSDGGPPNATALWPAADRGSTHLVARAINAARGERTTRLGRELAPMAVRYIVVTRRAAPTGKRQGADAAAVATIVRGLGAQLDLKLVSEDGDRVVYENAAWGAGRGRVRLVSGEDDVTAEDLAGSVPALRHERSSLWFTGRLDAGDTVYVSQTASSRWQLRSGGGGAVRRRAFGWAATYSVRRGGTATLRYRTPPVRYVVVLIEVALWVVAARFLLRERLRRRRAT